MIDFGQLGDVVLSLPALEAIRQRFPEAKIRLVVGKATAEVVRMAAVADDIIAVDRVALRDGSKAASIAAILRLVRDVRRRDFDFVIDLHSLYETNLLGYLSGANYRLFANRENRSFDRLANFPVKPPAEDKGLHHTDRYFQVLRPLGIVRPAEQYRLAIEPDAMTKARAFLDKLSLSKPHRAGLFLGAGHRDRLWGIDNFVELAKLLAKRGDTDVLVFLGPEEEKLRGEALRLFNDHAAVVEDLPLPIFIAMLSTLDVFVSADTGPMHLAAVAGAAIVLIAVAHTAEYFLPLTESLELVKARTVIEVKVDDVYDAVSRSMAKNDIRRGSC